jgi:hypothetical protein
MVITGLFLAGHLYFIRINAVKTDVRTDMKIANVTHAGIPNNKE